MKKIIVIFLIIALMLTVLLFACAKNGEEETKSCVSTHDFNTTETTTGAPVVPVPRNNIYSCGLFAIGKANGTAAHKIIFNNMEELLEYNSCENMVCFIEDFLWEGYFEEYVLIGYYFEFDNEKYSLSTEMQKNVNGDVFCDIVATDEGKIDVKHEPLGYFAAVCASKEWIASGKEICFSTEKLLENGGFYWSSECVASIGDHAYAIRNKVWSASSNAISYGKIMLSASEIRAEMKDVCPNTEETEAIWAGFDKEFFKENFLLYLTLNSAEAPSALTVSEVKKGESIYISIDCKDRDSVPNDMASYTLLVVLPKTDVTGNEQVSVDVLEGKIDISDMGVLDFESSDGFKALPSGKGYMIQNHYSVGHYYEIAKSPSEISEKVKNNCTFRVEQKALFESFDEKFFEEYALVFVGTTKIPDIYAPDAVEVKEIVKGERISVDFIRYIGEMEPCVSIPEELAVSYTVILVVDRESVDGNEKVYLENVQIRED